MYIEKSLIESVQKINEDAFLIKILSPAISSIAQPGQFCNIKVTDNSYPLLRRPFSICNHEGDSLFFLFDIHGEGTKILSTKKAGDYIDVLGPLGKGFDLNGKFATTIIIAGGLGVAPFPFLLKKLPLKKEVFCFIGGRTKKHIITYGLKNVFVATDDGSEGLHGTVVDLLKNEIKNMSMSKFRIFACGPTPMLKALQKHCIEKNYDCQISIECAMACGFGICQGCPVDTADGKSYLLACKDGPVFNVNDIKL